MTSKPTVIAFSLLTLEGSEEFEQYFLPVTSVADQAEITEGSFRGPNALLDTRQQVGKID